MSDGELAHIARLRVGHGPWTGGSPIAWSRVRDSFRADCVIVGAGITGSLLAQHLTARGLKIALVDRLSPGAGSTAASTAMLQWEIDKGIAELSDLYGFEHARRAYGYSVASVRGLGALVASLGLDCAFHWRNALFLAGEGDDARGVETEHAVRQRAGLPGEIAGPDRLDDAFGISRAAAILSPGAAEVDPLSLSRGLLRHALDGGAQLFHDDVVAYDFTPRAARAALASGFEIEARSLILATGYDLPDFLKLPAHRMSASWAAVTAPQTPLAFWRGRALVWEDDTPYLYARTTVDGRILVGGEDEAIADPVARADVTLGKAAKLHARLQRLWGRDLPPFESAWSAEFGETSDGLPLIGPVPGCPNAYAAYGYGGNGITFSYLASRLIGALVSAGSFADSGLFALDRPPV